MLTYEHRLKFGKLRLLLRCYGMHF